MSFRFSPADCERISPLVSDCAISSGLRVASCAREGMRSRACSWQAAQRSAYSALPAGGSGSSSATATPNTNTQPTAMNACARQLLDISLLPRGSNPHPTGQRSPPTRYCRAHG
jgi:hypothetical protein